MIAGKIQPNIPSTRALITSCATTQILKLLQRNTDVRCYENGYFNLACPDYVFSEPLGPIRYRSREYDPMIMGKVKAIPEGFTAYDKIVIEGPMTFLEFIAKMKADFNVEVTLISSGGVALFNSYLPGHKHAVRLPRNIEDVYNEISEEPLPERKTYMILSVGGEDIEEACDFECPSIKYFYKPRK